MRLTLLVPELIWPEPADQLTLGKLALPGLAWLTGRSQLDRHPKRAFEAALAAQFGLDDAPFGALRLLGEPGSPMVIDGEWLCADPVHLRFHHERIVLADAGAFDLDLDEAQALTAALNTEFADLGEFHVADARRWYLRTRLTVNRKFAPISQIAGKRLDGELESEANPLRRWLNEIQMFLHGHPVNAAREAAGKPAVNSLWLWGPGPLPAANPQQLTTVWSDNPLAIGLARSQGVAHQALPATLADVLDQAGRSGHTLVVLDSLLGPVLYENGEDWRHASLALDANWLQPAAAALGRRIDTLTLIAPTIYGELHWKLTGGARWKFWRKGKPIAAMADELARSPSAQPSSQDHAA